jgi:small subunit ribosomal protein S8
MQITDAVADMLTRIRNASSSNHPSVKVPGSKIKQSIAQILLEEGYIKGYEFIEDDKQGVIKISLKYAAGKKSVIRGLKRISKPGLRIYTGYRELPKVLGGLGIAIISTSNGVMTDRKARAAQAGGEVLAFIW